jgi:methionyl-tRNA synthetase
MSDSVHEKGRWRLAGKQIVQPGHRIGKPEPLFRKLPADFDKKIVELLPKVREKVMQQRPPLLRW